MRLIDADNVIEELLPITKYGNVTGNVVASCIVAIKNAPTIDAEPVRHGRWIFDQHRWICSECHENPTFGMGYVQSERGLYNYCPNCGAKMDEEVDT